MICLEREKKLEKYGSGVSIGGLVGFVILGYVFFSFIWALGFWR
jgi:hypothetical protein